MGHERDDAMTAVAPNRQGEGKLAALLIIGDEILSGRTQDKNLVCLGLSLAPLGIEVRHVRIIHDDIPTIVRHVNELRQAYDYVFTSGGIGPTHDDVTAEAIAAAFGVELRIEAEADRRLAEYYQRRGVDYTDNRRRMARVPLGGTLIDNPLTVAPGFAIGNLFVLAGVPEIFRAMLEQITPTLEAGAPIRQTMLSAFVGESMIADQLGAVAARFPHISVGCYPTWSQNRPMTTIVVRGRDEIMISEAAAAIMSFLPKD